MPTSTVLCVIVAVVISAALVSWGQHPELWNIEKAATLAFVPLRSTISDRRPSQVSRLPYPIPALPCLESSRDGAVIPCAGLIAPLHFGEEAKRWSVDHFTDGDAYAMRNQFDKAIVEYDGAILLNPDVAETYFRRGLMFFAKNENTRAIADFSAAIRLDARNALAYKDRGEAYVAVGYYDNAIADFDNAVRLKPNLAAAFIGRGRAYQGKGDVDRAQADFAEASRLGEVLPAPAPTVSGQAMESGGK